MHRLTAFLCALLLGLGSAVWADDANPRVRITTNKGDIVLQLDRAKAPKTVENFLRYVQSGFYDGTIFHRVIDNFMIQGGGLNADMIDKPTHEPIQNEAGNGLKNARGTIAMARTNDPHSATAQFFINVKDNHFLDHRMPSGDGWGYCVFGKVVDGMDVVDRIKGVATGRVSFHQDVPVEPIVIEKVEIVD